MDGIFVFLFLGLALIVGLLAKYIFQRTRIPDVLFLLGFGVLFSYLGLAADLQKPSTLLNLLIVFALIYIVFTGGLPIRLKAVFSSAKWVVISSLLNVIGITSIVFVFALLYRFPLRDALIIGILLCVVDGSIINSILEIVHLSKRAEAFIQMESALIDIFVIIAIISITNFTRVDLTAIFQRFMNFLFLSLAIGATIALVWSFILKKLQGMKHLPITTLTVLLLVYFLAEYSGANGVIAIFVFSIVLGNIALLRGLFYKGEAKGVGVLTREQRRFFDDFTFFLRTLLFVYMGALIHFGDLFYLFLGLLFVIIAFIIRSFIYRVIRTKDMPRKDKNIMESLATKGLTPIVMVSLLAGNAAITNTILGAIIFSVIISSVLVYAVEKNKFTTISDLFLGPPGRKRKK